MASTFEVRENQIPRVLIPERDMTAEGMHIGATCVDEHEILSAAAVLTPGEMEVNAYRPSQDPRRAGARILDTAEGVLVAIHRCSLNQAFIDIVHTAKSHNISPLSRC